MSDHDEAGMESHDLCDKLYECLSQQIPRLNRSESKRWCIIYQEGRNRFAYVNHRKRMNRIEVWCLGDPIKLQQNTNLNIKPRQQATGVFGAFQSRFFVNNLLEVASACELLYRV